MIEKNRPRRKKPRINKNRTPNQLRTFETKGINTPKTRGAISMASASIMTDLMKEKKEKEVKELVDDFLQMIKESPEMKTKLISENEKTKLMSLSGVKQYPMRVKCATLAWHTLTSAMNNSQEETNTEKFD